MMKKVWNKIAAMAIAATVTVIGASTAASAFYVDENSPYYPDDMYVSVTGSLNLRTSPRLDSTIVDSLYNGTHVYVIGEVCENDGSYNPFLKVYCNGVEGYVSSDFLTATDPTYYGNNYGNNSGWGSGSYVIGTVIYPRIDRLISNGYYSTWCSLNTDGFYYNEYGEQFRDIGNGMFSDIYGNSLYVLQ